MGIVNDSLWKKASENIRHSGIEVIAVKVLCKSKRACWGGEAEVQCQKRNWHQPFFWLVFVAVKCTTWRVQAPTRSLGGGVMARSLLACLIAHPVVPLLPLSALLYGPRSTN